MKAQLELLIAAVLVLGGIFAVSRLGGTLVEKAIDKLAARVKGEKPTRWHDLPPDDQEK